ncbi:hypothetical protein WS61_02655 [Burkholderia sp. ABCPW 11]|nr:hypothetical protein WS61_02655 [Burkholderia sp. ABCPW 11]
MASWSTSLAPFASHAMTASIARAWQAERATTGSRAFAKANWLTPEPRPPARVVGRAPRARIASCGMRAGACSWHRNGVAMV